MQTLHVYIKNKNQHYGADFLKKAKEPEFKAAWDLLVVGTNASLILLVFLSELFAFLDALVKVADHFNYVPLTLFIPSKSWYLQRYVCGGVYSISIG